MAVARKDAFVVSTVFERIAVVGCEGIAVPRRAEGGIWKGIRKEHLKERVVMPTTATTLLIAQKYHLSSLAAPLITVNGIIESATSGNSHNRDSDAILSKHAGETSEKGV
ncbi:unnamed protein product [Onchocerca flexuosa]|uniref:Uncharacterized protein n=1 Tax=Onchocerca flexuosa TaxID=387005 RepID=A0A183H698_9BILA|nr:unnamed protein product [Onchocerca flexuosa]